MIHHDTILASVLKPIGMLLFSVSLIKVHEGLSIIAVLLTIGYVGRKWYVFEKNKNKKDN